MTSIYDLEQARLLAEDLDGALTRTDVMDAIFEAAPSDKSLTVAAAAVGRLAFEIYGAERAAALIPVLLEIMRHTIRISRDASYRAENRI